MRRPICNQLKLLCIYVPFDLPAPDVYFRVTAGYRGVALWPTPFKRLREQRKPILSPMDSTNSARPRAAATAEPLPTRRAKITNDPMSVRVSLNTADGRRVADLYRSFLRAMGGPTDAVAQANVLAAAELTVATETARVQLLAGKADVDQLVRLENLAARAVRRLGIKLGSGKPAVPKLAEYLANRETPA